MRNIVLEVEYGTPGCCGLTEIFTFPNLGSYDGGRWVSEKSFSSDEWRGALLLSGLKVGSDGAHYFFSHAHHQRGPATPRKFASWLKRQGESVVVTPPRKNGSQGIITAYFWTPSKKFINKFNKFREEQEKKNDAGSSSSN